MLWPMFQAEGQDETLDGTTVFRVLVVGNGTEYYAAVGPNDCCSDEGKDHICFIKTQPHRSAETAITKLWSLTVAMLYRPDKWEFIVTRRGHEWIARRDGLC